RFKMSHRQARQAREENRLKKTLGDLRALGGSKMSHRQERQGREENRLKKPWRSLRPWRFNKAPPPSTPRPQRKPSKKPLAAQQCPTARHIKNEKNLTNPLRLHDSKL
ncbi:MAG: hypothetical protein ACOY0R_19565, partial [Chloroflexota bacterium]